MKSKIALKYGGIGGVLIVSTWFLTINEDTEFSGGEILGYAIMLVALTSVFMGIKKVRDEKGSLTFKEGFLNGLAITLVASVIYVIGWMAYWPAFAPDFADKYTTSQIEMVQEMDIDQESKDEQIEDIKDWMETYKKPHVMAAITFTEIFPVGLIVTLLSALILKRK